MAYFQNIPNATACFSLKLLRAFLTSDKLIISNGKKNIHDNNETLGEEEKIETTIFRIVQVRSFYVQQESTTISVRRVVDPGTNDNDKVSYTFFL